MHNSPLTGQTGQVPVVYIILTSDTSSYPTIESLPKVFDHDLSKTAFNSVDCITKADMTSQSLETDYF